MISFFVPKDISEEDIQDVPMPTAIPFIYKFDENMIPIKPDEGKLTHVHTSGIFLEKPGLLKEALKRQEDWVDFVPGFESSEEVIPGAKRATTLEQSLLKLKKEQEDEYWVEKFGSIKNQINLVDGGATSANFVTFADDNSEFEDPVVVDPEFVDDDNFFTINMQPLPSEKEAPNVGQAGDQNDPVVVLIRHGRTPHNNLGLFTGWEDPPLAEDGIEDAKNAGKLLKRHGFKFDVVYSSWLIRAIDTAWYVLDELDLTWLPIVKSWRLNERMCEYSYS